MIFVAVFKQTLHRSKLKRIVDIHYYMANFWRDLVAIILVLFVIHVCRTHETKPKIFGVIPDTKQILKKNLPVTLLKF